MLEAAVVLLATAAVAPTRFDELQASLARTAAGDEEVRRFIERAGGTPIVEGTTAIFLVEGEAATPPRIVGDFNGWGEGEAGARASRLDRLASTGFFFRRVELRSDARVEYLVAVGDAEAPDPLNPRRVESFAGTQSELRMPGYVEVVDRSPDPSVPRGHVTAFEHRSAILGNARRVFVYLPPGYDPKAPRRYPEIWLGDGANYVERVGVPAILDRLIAFGRLEPVVAILVDTPDRRVEYDLHAGYRRMVLEELVPRIAAEYRVENQSARRFLGGGSRGGQMAIDLCLAAPEVFGLCGAWAPAISPRTAAGFLGGRRSSGRFVLVRALYDDRFGPDAPALRDGLAAVGDRVAYLEAPQGHTRAAWPDLTALTLIEAFPAPRR